MTSLTALDVPRPKDWQAFERIVLGALSQKWKRTHFVKNGRDGQSQKGVDITGDDPLGKTIGVQCKHTKKLSIDTVLSEVKKAEKFAGGLSEFYMATSAEHDALLQEKVREVSKGRIKQGKFPVLLLFWDDIVAALALDRRAFSSYYPGLVVPKKIVSGIDSTSYAAWELGYHGGSLRDDLDLITGEAGEMGGADPDQLYSRIRIVQSRVRQLLPPDDAEDIDSMLSELSGYLLDPSGKSFIHVSFIATRVTRRIRDSSSFLNKKRALAMDLGVALKRLYYHDGKIKGSIRESILEHVMAVLPGREKQINKAFKVAAKKGLRYGWSLDIFSFVNKELRLLR